MPINVKIVLNGQTLELSGDLQLNDVTVGLIGAFIETVADDPLAESDEQIAALDAQTDALASAVRENQDRLVKEQAEIDAEANPVTSQP